MQNLLAVDKGNLVVQDMLLPSKGENALNGKPRGSVPEGMNVHFLTLPKLGGREKVRRAAGQKVVAAETGERHRQLTLVEEAPPRAEE